MTKLADINRSIEQMPTSEIAPIVQSALGDASASPVTGWTASPMRAESIGQGTLGFAQVSGMATTSFGKKLVGWSSVVKAVNPADASLRGEDSFDTSEREIGFYRSGF
ncbi:MAG: hypothetical protein IH877_09705, partial [Gemmatimonadetes bacterium]|nr:hypothetical protein [Gemmatimonadota bacterium]